MLTQVPSRIHLQEHSAAMTDANSLRYRTGHRTGTDACRCGGDPARGPAHCVTLPRDEAGLPKAGPGRYPRAEPDWSAVKVRNSWFRPVTACPPPRLGGPRGARVTTATRTGTAWREPHSRAGRSPCVIR